MPILSWYDNPEDRELDRLTPVLEYLAYEDDVRKVLKKLIANNELNSVAEQQYLTQMAHRREHSQRVEDRNNPHCISS